ncbi:hypothetical protein HYH03_015066 [Edaphochlamys debaryana]|uniref:Cas12f1-like TNB domain-containing protein n=1 Tax=Edaphochlamys debaryana TaxID=47281 RepID=A0A835XLV9_9CHLO|nr:hypothetical protein HYH03_015066 [Edaphochlamys debaryana]|eukprot:KAG2486241.1 hypothetical protein HYH03_015066 [Edaphochlamys debaryana]
MGRRNPEGFVKKDELLARLGQQPGADLKKLKKLGKDELVWAAFDAGLMDVATRDASFTRRMSTIPCYLWTHIEDPELRAAIEQYVICYSQFYSRGTYLANLVALAALPEQLPQNVIDVEPAALAPVPDILLDENMAKHCFLPERWLDDGRPIDQQVMAAYAANQGVMEALRAGTDYKSVMDNRGWDNALNHMGTMFLGNTKVQVLTHLPKRLRRYLEHEHPCHPDTDRHQFVRAALGPLWTPSSALHQDDLDWALRLRAFLEMEAADATQWLRLYESSVLSDLCRKAWNLHLWLQGRASPDRGFSLLPVSALNRKYAYIDARVAEYLLKKGVSLAARKRLAAATQGHEGSELARMLGLTRKAFNKRRCKLRAQLRKKYAGEESAKVLHKKWRKIGAGCFPQHGDLKVIETDGVGLRLKLEFPNSERRPAPASGSCASGSCASGSCASGSCASGSCASGSCAICHGQVLSAPLAEGASPPGKPPLEVGIDKGRVRMFAAATSDDTLLFMTRRAYLYAQRDKRSKKWEAERMTGTAWGEALAAMSEAGGFKNRNMATWQATLGVVAQHLTVLREEQLLPKDRALARMRRFRWKKAFLERGVKKLVKPAIEEKRQVVLGMGDAKFASGGRGEISVPTEGVDAALRKVIRMHGIRELVKQRDIDEYLTTKCCCRCGKETVAAPTKRPDGKGSLRYRLCVNCGAGTAGKRRNRDVNAARNILLLLQAELRGLPRPEYLRRPIRAPQQKQTTSSGRRRRT